ncbi:MAG: hypothetical protein EOO13_05645 [Chitinophagaceae bacterium]|nr:MAG: hypothetical protein EOO13_05645 [Chitinophagaceae bacterium]
MKAIICTIGLWVIALAGYSQSFSVPMPKGLQCSNTPTWPLTHSKKPNNLQLNATSKTGAVTAPHSKPASMITAMPLIKLWLMTETNNKEEDN